MAKNDTFRRYLDAGMAFTQLTREKAEEFVSDLVKAGEVRRKETEEVIEALLERSRRNTEDLVGIIRSEIADQLRSLGLEDVAKRARLGSKATDAAATLDDAGKAAASSLSGDSAAKKTPEPKPKKSPAASKASTTKTPAVKKMPPAKAAPASKGTSPLVVPGAPKKAAAKKLIVPPSAGAPAAKRPPSPTKSGAAKKSGAANKS